MQRIAAKPTGSATHDDELLLELDDDELLLDELLLLDLRIEHAVCA